MRYGENPHQSAAFYRDLIAVPGGIAGYTQLQGKELSYNNIGDADAAWELVKTFDQPACVIVKHANPCGVAIADTALNAYKLAYSTDTTSAFGGIIAFNRELDAESATQITANQFVEVIIAPSASEAALKVTAAKQNVRVLTVPLSNAHNQFDFKRVSGGLLVQTPDTLNVQASQLKVVTKLQPTKEQLTDLLFAWRVAKYVKSNAIVFCKGGMTLGVGAGQMSRVDSTRIASIKAQNAGLSTGRFRGGLRCLLPVPRRRRRAGASRCQGRHPAGRLDARRRSDRRGGRAWAWRWCSPAIVTSGTNTVQSPFMLSQSRHERRT